MTTYAVIHLGKDGVETTDLIHADQVDRDPHWVTFYQNEAEATEAPVINCDCGQPRTIRPRASFAKKHLVALFPTHRVRLVKVSQYDH